MRGQRVPHGVAGLLVVLFALTGVAFSYGLGGHAPPPTPCVLHALWAGDSGPATVGVHAPDAQEQAQTPPLQPGPADFDSCLSLAVLLTLMVLGLAAMPRPLGTHPRRFGWTLSPPVWAPPRPRSLAVLQVLRL
ncbi:hypothetical protein [Thermomonospora sp. CIF 1]|uniref:hypothetical protein n=1 Tax=Thermomonospora sp. CIF 1 TaxID=1916083 RepID=UPI000CB26868|nr:hypothetical protein [Thermomonospora sp. CIF 1]PKK14440.1 MAG: hypothetical protein BUE48_010415 [Thermomonospora sp. CIF 1]